LETKVSNKKIHTLIKNEGKTVKVNKKSKPNYIKITTNYTIILI